MRKLRLNKEIKGRIEDSMVSVSKTAYVDGPTRGLKKAYSVAKEMESLMRYFYELGHIEGEQFERDYDKSLTAQH